jgi:hypothetical protein
MYKREKVVFMKKSLMHSRWPRSSLLVLSLVLMLSFLPQGAAQSPVQDPKSSPAAMAATPQTQAQKKAAERKRRFEEQRALLDGGGSAAAGAAMSTAAPDTDFYMDPIGVNMLANESQQLRVWDRRGTGNDVSARVSWGLSNSGIVDMTVSGYATITAKAPGTVTVTGRIDGHDVAATVTVHRGDKLPWGVPRAVSAPPTVRTGGRRNSMTVITNPN